MIIRHQSKEEFWTEERCHITEILNLEAIEYISLAQARVAPLTTTQVHQLDCHEIYYMLSGQGTLHLDEEDHVLKKGDTAFIQKGRHQSITNTSKSQDLVFLCICTPRFEVSMYTNIE